MESAWEGVGRKKGQAVKDAAASNGASAIAESVPEDREDPGAACALEDEVGTALCWDWALLFLGALLFLAFLYL